MTSAYNRRNIGRRCYKILRKCFAKHSTKMPRKMSFTHFLHFGERCLSGLGQMFFVLLSGRRLWRLVLGFWLEQFGDAFVYFFLLGLFATFGALTTFYALPTGATFDTFAFEVSRSRVDNLAFYVCQPLFRHRSPILHSSSSPECDKNVSLGTFDIKV